MKLLLSFIFVVNTHVNEPLLVLKISSSYCTFIIIMAYEYNQMVREVYGVCAYTYAYIDYINKNHFTFEKRSQHLRIIKNVVRPGWISMINITRTDLMCIYTHIKISMFSLFINIRITLFYFNTILDHLIRKR